jgi:hypothetical protein
VVPAPTFALWKQFIRHNRIPVLGKDEAASTGSFFLYIQTFKGK